MEGISSVAGCIMTGKPGGMVQWISGTRLCNRATCISIRSVSGWGLRPWPPSPISLGWEKRQGLSCRLNGLGSCLPTAWKQKAKNEPWLPGETISASIGQGYVNVTPLQMASLIGTVANDGAMFRPRLVQAVMDRASGNSNVGLRFSSGR